MKHSCHTDWWSFGLKNWRPVSHWYFHHSVMSQTHLQKSCLGEFNTNSNLYHQRCSLFNWIVQLLFSLVQRTLCSYFLKIDLSIFLVTLLMRLISAHLLVATFKPSKTSGRYELERLTFKAELPERTGMSSRRGGGSCSSASDLAFPDPPLWDSETASHEIQKYAFINKTIKKKIPLPKKEQRNRAKNLSFWHKVKEM